MKRYKRANDALHPDRALVEDTIEKMERGRGKRRQGLKWGLSAAAVVLAAALIVGLWPRVEQRGAVVSLGAFAISEPSYPAYPQRINAAHVEREDYFSEYRTYREEWGLTEDFDQAFAGKVGDFSAQTSRILLSGGTENRIYSPVSFWIALGMLAETTGGESREQILETLGVEDLESLRTGTQALWRRLYRDDGITATRLASSIWINSGFTYFEEPLDTLADCYYAGSYAVDMGTAEADQAIADWLDAQTENLLQESTIAIETDRLTALRLYSTIYYYGGWSAEFNPSQNTEDVFTRADGTEITATFMHAKRDSSTLLAENFTAARLYTENTSVCFVLPDEGVTVDEVLLDSALWENLFDGKRWESRKVEWSLPKFDVQSDLELQEAMEALGITDVFQEGKADFSPLVDEGALAEQGLTPPVLNEAHQAARLQVDEEGIRAVAYTELGADASAAEPPEEIVEMDLDRPFLVVIDSPVEGVPLFVGVIHDPTAA